MVEPVSIKCTNKECNFRFHYEIGFGMGCPWFVNVEREIKNGTIKVDKEITDLLDKSYSLKGKAQYLCETCKEWKTLEEPYIFEPIVVSPYGTIRDYKVHYVFGEPKCEKCGNNVTFILNPRSSKNPCPKCGKSTLIAK